MKIMETEKETEGNVKGKGKKTKVNMKTKGIETRSEKVLQC